MIRRAAILHASPLSVDHAFSRRELIKEGTSGKALAMDVRLWPFILGLSLSNGLCGEEAAVSVSELCEELALLVLNHFLLQVNLGNIVLLW